MRLPNPRGQPSLGIYGGFGRRPADAAYRPRVGTHEDDGSGDTKRLDPRDGKSARKRGGWRRYATRRQTSGALAGFVPGAVTAGIIMLVWAAWNATDIVRSRNPKSMGGFFILLVLGGLMTAWGVHQVVMEWKRERKAGEQHPIDQETLD